MLRTFFRVRAALAVCCFQLCVPQGASLSAQQSECCAVPEIAEVRAGYDYRGDIEVLVTGGGAAQGPFDLDCKIVVNQEEFGFGRRSPQDVSDTGVSTHILTPARIQALKSADRRSNFADLAWTSLKCTPLGRDGRRYTAIVFNSFVDVRHDGSETIKVDATQRYFPGDPQTITVVANPSNPAARIVSAKMKRQGNTVGVAAGDAIRPLRRGRQEVRFLVDSGVNLESSVGYEIEFDAELAGGVRARGFADGATPAAFTLFKEDAFEILNSPAVIEIFEAGEPESLTLELTRADAQLEMKVWPEGCNPAHDCARKAPFSPAGGGLKHSVDVSRLTVSANELFFFQVSGTAESKFVPGAFDELEGCCFGIIRKTTVPDLRELLVEVGGARVDVSFSLPTWAEKDRVSIRVEGTGVALDVGRSEEKAEDRTRRQFATSINTKALAQIRLPDGEEDTAGSEGVMETAKVSIKYGAHEIGQFGLRYLDTEALAQQLELARSMLSGKARDVAAAKQLIRSILESQGDEPTQAQVDDLAVALDALANGSKKEMRSTLVRALVAAGSWYFGVPLPAAAGAQ